MQHSSESHRAEVRRRQLESLITLGLSTLYAPFQPHSSDSSQGISSTESTEQTPSDEEDSSARPAQEKGCSQLSFLTDGHLWVVEFPDDDIGCPAHWNQNKDAGQDEENSGSSQKVRFHPVVRTCALDLLHATDANDESNEGESNGYTHEGSRCFHDRWKGQQGGVELALQPDLGLADTVHPEPFPESLKDDDVAANKR
ncbi:hypothetical protein H920_17009 [Fukomys damarensis]|uniref:Uncharacterized protein n=1 Tax=Fukomys damarensis TaxID=885580 RepID=A0A091CQW0_FUKDA|nr:hypothetical protein H920_17009 [Fukomys damarensis]